MKTHPGATKRKPDHQDPVLLLRTDDEDPTEKWRCPDQRPAPIRATSMRRTDWSEPHSCAARSLASLASVAGDQIKLNGNSPDHDGIALIDARRGTSCLKDEKFRGRTTISLGNLIPNDTSCPAPSGATIFTVNGAVDFRPELNWSSGNDTVPVDLSVPVKVKLKVWRLYDVCHPTPGQCTCTTRCPALRKGARVFQSSW